jgi:hypothetical protein
MLCTKSFSNSVLQSFIYVSDEPPDPNSESALLQSIFATPERSSKHTYANIQGMITVEMQEVTSVEPAHAAPGDDKSIPSLLSSEPHSSGRRTTSSHSHPGGEPSDDIVPNFVVSLDKSVGEFNTPSRTPPKSRGLTPAFPLQPKARHSFMAGAPINGIPPGLQRTGSLNNLVIPPLRPIRRSPISPSFASPLKESPRRPLPDIPESGDSIDKPEVSPPLRPIRRLPALVDTQAPPPRNLLRYSTLPRRPLPDIPPANVDQRRRSEFIVAPAPNYQRNRPHSPNQLQPSDEIDHVAHVHIGKPRPKPRDSLVLQRAKEYDAARGSFATHSVIERAHVSYRFIAENPQTAKSQSAGTDRLEALK